jgi:MSHA biogenesis protein MshO
MHNKKINGFTMIEMVISIAIMGIVGVGLSGYIKIPTASYNDVSKRQDLVDHADTALRKMKRELQAALPNSIRITSVGGKTFLEFILVQSSGRYRADYDNSGLGDILDFTTNDGSFDILSNPITFTGTEKIVVYNLGIPGYDAYNNDNMTNYTGTAGSKTNVVMNPKQFPLTSPNNKFYVVNTPVSYVCDPVAKHITRYDGYMFQNTQPSDETVIPLSTANTGILTDYVTGCYFNYSQGSDSRNGLVNIWIELTSGTEKIALYGDTNVSNM